MALSRKNIRLSQNVISAPCRSESGATLVEYCLLLCLFALSATALINIYIAPAEDEAVHVACVISAGGGTRGSEYYGGGDPVQQDYEECVAEKMRMLHAEELS